MNSYNSYEQAIIERLQAKVPELQQVSGYDELDKGLFTEVRKSPAAFVIWDGTDRPADQQGGLSLIETRFGVVLAIRGGNNKATTRAQLYDLTEAIMKAMDRPKTDEGKPHPLLAKARLLEGPEPRYFEGGSAAVVLIYGIRQIAPVAIG